MIRKLTKLEESKVRKVYLEIFTELAAADRIVPRRLEQAKHDAQHSTVADLLGSIEHEKGIKERLGFDPWSRPKLRLAVLAFHIEQLCLTEAPAQFGLTSCEGMEEVKVRIEPPKNLTGHEWDNIFLNDNWCGNRHGGVEAFCKIIAALQPELID